MAQSSEYEYQNKKYKLSKINAMKQFHIVRRISPMLGEMIPALKSLSKKTDLTDDEQMDQMAVIAAPMFNGLGKLSDKDSEFLLYSLLQAVEVQNANEGNWIKLSTGDALMIHDLELPVMLHAAVRAFAFNLQSFFSTLQATSR